MAVSILSSSSVPGCQRIDAFELWCWRRLLRALWTSKRSNQSIHPKGDQSWVFTGKTDVKAELQFFGHLMQRINALEKTLMLGMIDGKRRG